MYVLHGNGTTLVVVGVDLYVTQSFRHFHHPLVELLLNAVDGRKAESYIVDELRIGNVLPSIDTIREDVLSGVIVVEGGEIGGSVNQVGELLFGQQLEVFIGRTEESGCNAISGSHTVGTCLEGSGETFNVAHHHHGRHLTVFLLAVLQY